MIDVSDARVQQVIDEWHEAGRAAFEASYKSLGYDGPCYRTRFVRKQRYICLDKGNGGVYVVDMTDGTIYRIKYKYGVPNFKRSMGNILTINGADLNR